MELKTYAKLPAHALSTHNVLVAVRVRSLTECAVFQTRLNDLRPLGDRAVYRTPIHGTIPIPAASDSPPHRRLANGTSDGEAVELFLCLGDLWPLEGAAISRTPTRNNLPFAVSWRLQKGPQAPCQR